MFPLVFFILGAIIASFVGVVVARLHTGQSFLSGRSRCDVCDASLTPISLVPIISYFIYRGRARCCGARISFYAPLTEILLGTLFAISYVRTGMSLVLVGMLLSLSLLLALVLYDIEHQILPAVLLYPFVIVSAVTGFFLAPDINAFLQTFLIASLIASSLALIHFLSRGRAMGLADTPLSFGLALLTGTASFSGFIFSFWAGAVIGIYILLRRPRGSRIGIEVPFAPFLAVGFLLAYFTQWNLTTLITGLH